MDNYITPAAQAVGRGVQTAAPYAENVAGLLAGLPLAAYEIDRRGPLGYLQARNQLLQDPGIRQMAGPFTAGFLEVAGGPQNFPPLPPEAQLQTALSRAALETLPHLSQQQVGQAVLGVKPSPEEQMAAYAPFLQGGGFRLQGIGPGGPRFTATPSPTPDLIPVPGIEGTYYDRNSGRYITPKQQQGMSLEEILGVLQGGQPPSGGPGTPSPAGGPAPAPPPPGTGAPSPAPQGALPQGFVPLRPDDPNLDRDVGYPSPAFADDVTVPTPRGPLRTPVTNQEIGFTPPSRPMPPPGIPAAPPAMSAIPGGAPQAQRLGVKSFRLPVRGGGAVTLGPPAGAGKSDFTEAARQKALGILTRAKTAIQRLRSQGILTDSPLSSLGYGPVSYNHLALEYAARTSKDAQTREDATFLLKNLQSAVPTLARGFGEQRTNIQEEQRIRDALAFQAGPANMSEAVIDNYIQLFGGQAQTQGRVLGFTPDR